MRQKPFISLRNRKTRVKLAKEHAHKDGSFWTTVSFSDESKFNLHGSDGRVFVWRKPGEEFQPDCTKGTVKHGGGNVKVCGCFSYSGVGKLVCIDGIMNSEAYRCILDANLQKSAKKLFKRQKWIFQQDNDPKHTSRLLKEHFAKKKMSVLEWPSQSPDLSPIEHLWDAIEMKMSGRQCTHGDELKALLAETWRKHLNCDLY